MRQPIDRKTGFAAEAATRLRDGASGATSSDNLGISQRVAQESTLRLLNRDGSFNVRRTGRSFFRSLHLYHSLLTMSWTKFHAAVIFSYLAVNLLFACGYVLCGTGALSESKAQGLGGRLAEAFFFSVQTLSTIGYGQLSPQTLAANILVSIEALAGLLGFALATGILFARFARPQAKMLFSRSAVIAPYQGIRAFEFRVANERNSQLAEVTATVVLSRLENQDGIRRRQVYPLRLEREKIMFLPLHWVVVHPIDESSPLYGVKREDLLESQAEFLILLTAFDETFSQTVHTRSSYKPDEIEWGAKFADMYAAPEDGKVSIDLRRIHQTEPAEI